VSCGLKEGFAEGGELRAHLYGFLYVYVYMGLYVYICIWVYMGGFICVYGFIRYIMGLYVGLFYGFMWVFYLRQVYFVHNHYLGF
jgi:hypothetical protein